jgi:hypothetical protein
VSHTAEHWLDALQGLGIDEPVRIMNTAIPQAIELVPGPGCPVCICPEEDVFEAIQLALNEDITLVAFGDMLRVPVNVPKREPRSLEQARAAGADIRPIASPSDAVRIAREDPSRTVVFFAAGFETTTAPVAAMLAEGAPGNLLVLLSGRLTWPAVAMLLDSGTPGFDALIAPGHVSTVMGPEEWEFVVDKHGIPAAVAGFRPDTLLAAMYSKVVCSSTTVTRKSCGRAATRWRVANSPKSWTLSMRTGVASASSRSPATRYGRPMPNTMRGWYTSRTPMIRANVSGKCHRAATAPTSYKCHRAATAPTSYSGSCTRTSAAFMAWPARRESR